MYRQFVRRIHNFKLSKDETCFVAHHPGVAHGYEHTRALPKAAAKSESLLKEDSRNMISKSPNLEQLQTLTYTHSITWRQFQGKEKREKYRRTFDDNVDRPGLTS